MTGNSRHAIILAPFHAMVMIHVHPVYQLVVYTVVTLSANDNAFFHVLLVRRSASVDAFTAGVPCHARLLVITSHAPSGARSACNAVTNAHQHVVKSVLPSFIVKFAETGLFGIK